MAASVDAAARHGELKRDTPRLVGFLDSAQQLEGLGSAATITERMGLCCPQCKVGHYLRLGVVVELANSGGYMPSG
ncbi:hypothetical protein D3C72_2331660 [compost metagenome]